jgi:hypothetical protein
MEKRQFNTKLQLSGENRLFDIVKNGDLVEAYLKSPCYRSRYDTIFTLAGICDIYDLPGSRFEKMDSSWYLINNDKKKWIDHHFTWHEISGCLVGYVELIQRENGSSLFTAKSKTPWLFLHSNIRQDTYGKLQLAKEPTLGVIASAIEAVIIRAENRIDC